jgi:hypothetical protein
MGAQPGERNVFADVGFVEFRREIIYKAEQGGSNVLIVSQWEPSSFARFMRENPKFG